MSQWRVILNVLDKPAPDFDEVRHAGLCSEASSLLLNLLYFANQKYSLNPYMLQSQEQG